MCRKYFLAVLFAVYLPAVLNAEIKEEKSERAYLNIPQETYPLKIRTETGIFLGYDGNVLLNTERKGDIFQKTYWFVNINKKIRKDWGVNLSYYGDYWNYSEFNDASSMVNNIRLEAYRYLGKVKLGSGYDFTYMYYPFNSEGDFFFHKGFVYFKYSLTRNLYNKLSLTYGSKNFISAKALSDTYSTYQNKNRLDKRFFCRNEVGIYLNRNTLLRLIAGFRKNNSNSRFEDYYDYDAYTGGIRLDVKITPKIIGFTDLFFTRKKMSPTPCLLTR